MAARTAAAAPAPAPTVRTRDALAITVGIVLGAGIFKTPSLVAGNVGSAGELVGVWIAGAVVALIGALCYAELAAAWREAGGDYAWLRRAFGQRLAFLYGWARLTVIQTGSIAILAFVFGDYLAAVLPLGPNGPAIYAGAAVTLLTLVNWLGIREGTRTQNLLTLVEVAGLALVIAAALSLPAAAPPAAPATGGSTGALGLAMVFVLLTYGGWNEAVFLTSELRGGPRRIVRVLVGGLAIIAALYLGANLAFLHALGLQGMAVSSAVGADVMRMALGAPGAALIAVAVAVAALTSANATIITGARSAFALGRDLPALGWLGRWDTPRGTPGNALLLQGAIALALVLAGAFARDGFTLAVEYSAPVFWLFFLLTGLALFRLRATAPRHPRPFRVPLYPVLPALFVAANAWLLWSALAYAGRGALVGLAVLAAGALVLAFLPVPKKEPAA